MFSAWKFSKRDLLAAVVIFVAYLLAVKVGAFLYAGGRSAPAIVFPAAGIAITALFLQGYRFWWVIALASLGNSLYSGTTILIGLGIALGSSLQALLGAYLLRRFKFDARIWRLRDMALVVAMAVSVTIISPSISTLVSIATNIWGAIPAVQRWISWWLGGVLSVMLLTPFLVSWISNPRPGGARRRFWEMGLAFLFLIGISFVIYWTPYSGIGNVPLVYVLLVPLFWISLRFGNRETITALLITTVISLAGAVFGWHGQSVATLGMRLFQLQLFGIIISAIFFIVSAISEERRLAEATSKGYIAQLEEALEKLRSADQAKTEFIAILAHELRNPLAPALSSIEFLELQGLHTPEKEAATMQAKRNLRNMSHLLDDLLDVSRINQGKIRLQKESISIAEVMGRVAENMRVVIDERKHALAVEMPRDLPRVQADPLRLEQVITNLLTNSAKYTDPGGQIRVTAGVEREDMVVKVKDTGVGISPDTLPFIFEMFNQANRTGKRASAGLGIGLGLVKKLVELHGGSVAAQSEGPGKGSEFTVRIPLGTPSAEFAAKPLKEKKPPAPELLVGKKRVLVVDDNEAAANILVKLFDKLGQEARAAYSGEQGIGAALALEPHLILLDIGLPDMTGYEVVKKLRTYPQFATTVIAAVSGYGQEEDRQRSREAGFDHHLVKPVGLDSWRDLLGKI